MGNRLRVMLILAVFGLPAAFAANDQEPILLQDKGVQITRAELVRELAALPDDKRSEVLRSAASLQEFIAELFSWRTLEQEAEQLALLSDPQVEQRIRAVRQYVIREAVLAHRREQASNRPDYEEIAHDYYLANQDQYAKPRRIRLAQIFLAMDSCNAEEVRVKAQSILEQLKAGADFAELAKQHSDGPNAAEGGAFREWMTEPEEIQNPVVKAAFALSEVGQISDIIESQGGLHILRLNADQKAYIEPFDQVKERLIQKVTKEHHAKINAELLQQFYPSAEAQINQSALDDLLKK